MTLPDQAEIRLAIQTDQRSVTPGSRLDVVLLLSNFGKTPDQVRISVSGIPLVWVSTEQPVLLLQPGEQRQVSLAIQPPAPPNARTGRYTMQFHAVSAIDPNRSAQAIADLTVAGFEVKGRVGVLLDGVQYSVSPGDQLNIPVVLINQGLAADTFRLGIEGLPAGWASIPAPVLPLEPGEIKEAVLTLRPPRTPDSRPGRQKFAILVGSQVAPEQSVQVDCTLTVAAFIHFQSALEAANPDQNLPARVQIQNLSNIPVNFTVSWTSPEDTLTFEPVEPQQVNLNGGDSASLEYTVRTARRLWVGGEQSFPYTVSVQAPNQRPQLLEGSSIGKGLLPVWAAVAGAAVLLLLCLCLAGMLIYPRLSQQQPSYTGTPLLTSTATVIQPTATQSQLDQSALLTGRNWYLTSFNDTHSSASGKEAFTLFNPNGTLVGFTGCKDLSASYQTNFNQISITNINLSNGACPDAALQQQEDAMVNILRSARSYFVADTALQIAGDAGFLNFSLTPVNRPDEVQPPQAVMQIVPQAQVGQVVVFDGTRSNGSVPIVTWQWDFGDGGNARGEVVQHTYRDAGTYTVSLTVTDQSGQTGSATQQIHILPAPVPTAAPTPAPPTLAPDLPTPTTAPTPEPPPQLDPPQASISGPNQGFIGEPVEFDASASRPGSSPITGYNFSFGNGEVSPVSPSPSVSTIYTRSGDFEVTVFVVDENGLSSNATTRITINARLNTSVWSLAAMNNQPLVPGTAITLQFMQNELAGFAGCNTYSGSYTSVDNGDGTSSVTVERVQSGRSACPADIMNQESNYLAILQQVTSASIQENALTLTSPAGTLVFYLVSQP